MNEKQSLKENTRHGTSGQPVTAIHFTTGAGTFYPDHFFVERHWHYPVEILKITKGTFTVEINLETYTLHAGDICFINSEELHRLEGLEPVTVHDAVIFHPHILEFSYPDEFQEQYAAPFLSHASSLPRLLTPEDPLYPAIAGLFDRAAALAEAGKDGWYFRVKLLILEMFYELCIHKKMPAAEELLSAAGKERISRYKKIVSYFEKKLYEQDHSGRSGFRGTGKPSVSLSFFQRDRRGISRSVSHPVPYRQGQGSPSGNHPEYPGDQSGLRI